MRIERLLAPRITALAATPPVDAFRLVRIRDWPKLSR
jgi:hypothetical protein